MSEPIQAGMSLSVAGISTVRPRESLVDGLAASVTDIGASDRVYDVLPAVLARLGTALHFDHAFIVDTAAGRESGDDPDLLFQWGASARAAPPPTDGVLPPRKLLEAADWLALLSEGQPVALLMSSAPAGARELMNARGALSALVVPLLVKGDPWGFVGFDNCHQEREWTQEQVRSLVVLAQIIGAAIMRERFRQQARQRERLLQAVTRCAARIGGAHDLHATLDDSLATLGAAVDVERVLLVQVVPDATGAPRALLRNGWQRCREAGPRLQIIHDTGLAMDPAIQAWMRPLHEGAAVEAQLSSAPPAVRALLRQLQAHSSLLVPIMCEGRYWGHIGLDACGYERRWTGPDVDALRLLADMIGTAVTRTRYVTELARAETIVQNSPTVLYRLGGDSRLPMVYVSRNIERIGVRQQDLLADPLLYRSLIHPEDRERVIAALELLRQREGGPGRIEFRMATPDSAAVRWFECSYAPVRDDARRLLEIEGMLIDISERKSAEASIAQLARTDPLTGLANRMTFSDHLRQAFASAQRGGRSFAVLYLDLDRFKEVNDTLGHHAGDRLLQEAGRRLRDVTREIDLVARLGGDEFAIVQAGIDDSTAAGTLAEKLIEIVSAPYVIDGNELRIGVSIGVSLHDSHTSDPDALLMQADQALYRAKHAGRGQYRFHSDEIDHEVRAHMSLAEDLRSALARNELELRYQPQVELASGRIVGMEALLRWNHPARGTLLPEDFLPIAEKYGLMQQLGRWTIDTACRQMSLWRAASMQVPVVAINVSLAQIKMGREFVRDVLASIARWGLKPGDIELDVTELVLARSTLTQSNVLDQLRRVGVGIAIDNFGAQYSSLDYLRTYRVSRLKIARGMIAAADAEPGGVAMVRAILSLAAELGINVVAEGVETETQRRLLVRAGQLTQGQGFFYSRALPAEDTLSMLRAGVIEPAAPESASPGSPADPAVKAPGTRAATGS